MANYFCPIASIFQFFNDSGVVLHSGKVYTYLAGTTTPQTTYTSISGGTPNANPIILTSAGRLPNVQIWQASGVNLKIVVTDVNGNPIGPVFDQVSGVGDPLGLLSALRVPASGSGVDLVANAMRSYDIFSSVRASNLPTVRAGQTLIIDVQGGSSINDGIGGFFLWDASSTASDDNQNVLKLAASVTGRYIRLGYFVPNTLLSFSTLAALRGVPVPIMQSGQTLIVDCEGGASTGDALGGQFYWSPTSTAADDGATVIKPTAAGLTGRFLRLVIPPSLVSSAAVTQYFSQSLVTNGYTIFPNGLILQWGFASAVDAVNPVDIAITFPHVFPTGCLGVWVATGRSVAANGQATDGSNFASSLTPTGATITVDFTGSGHATAVWMAVGN